ncbi:MAG: hypothetical protein LBU39_03335 [Desulfobulbaceae bacterium]|nr:hypothetical protein [Desulfobulbaceae bacterium]
MNGSRNIALRLTLILGLPVAVVCALSLPLILLGLAPADPCPWNWRSVYIIDLMYGLALGKVLFDLMRPGFDNKTRLAAIGGYTTLAFGQAMLESVLDFAGVQAAPITAKWPIFFFMAAGFILGLSLLRLAFRDERSGSIPSSFQERQS